MPLQRLSLLDAAYPLKTLRVSSVEDFNQLPRIKIRHSAALSNLITLHINCTWCPISRIKVREKLLQVCARHIEKKISKILAWLDFHGNIYYTFYFWLIRNVAAFESRTKFIFQPVVTQRKNCTTNMSL